MTPARLVFVYNADSGPVSAALDFAHKILSPATYGCALCAVTHGPFTMRGEWRDWLRKSPMPAVFYHRDEFARAFPEATARLPAILVETGAGALDLVVGPDELKSQPNASSLIALLESRLR